MVFIKLLRNAWNRMTMRPVYFSLLATVPLTTFYCREMERPTINVFFLGNPGHKNNSDYKDYLEASLKELSRQLNFDFSLNSILNSQREDFFKQSEVEQRDSVIPRVFIRIGNSLEEFSILNLIEPSAHTKEKLSTFINLTPTSDLTTIRSELHKINSRGEGKLFVLEGCKDKNIDFLRGKKNKLLCTENKELSSFMRLKPNHVLEFLSAGFPNKPANEDRLREIEDLEVEEIYKNDPISAQIHCDLFRNELKPVNKNFEIVERNLNSAKYGLNRLMRDKFKKIVYESDCKAKERVITDRLKIEETLKKKPAIVLGTYFPEFSLLKQDKLGDLLSSSEHIFDHVFLTKSSKFAEKHDFIAGIKLLQQMSQFKLFDINSKGRLQTISTDKNSFRETLSSYLSGKAYLSDIQEPLELPSLCEQVNADDFEDKVLRDSTFQECLVEIKSKTCPACFIGSHALDLLSLQFKDKPFKFFRMESSNQIKHLGDFEATPFYIHLVKKGSKIVKMTEIPKDSLVPTLKQHSSLDLSQINGPSSFGLAFQILMTKKFLEPSFDPLKAFNKEKTKNN